MLLIGGLMKRDLILPVFEDGKDTPERRGIGKGQGTLAGCIYAVLAISVSRFHEAYAVFITLLRLFAGSQELADYFRNGSPGCLCCL